MKSELIAATPPASVAGLTLAGVSLSQWVLILTAVYTVLVIIKTLPGAIEACHRGWLWLKERYDQSNRS